MNYIRKRLFREKQNIFFIVLFFICTLILLIAFSYRDTFLHQIDMSFKYDISGRSLLVTPSRDALNNMTEEDFINYKYDFEAIKKIEHVDAATTDIRIFLPTDFKDSNYDGRIGIDYANKSIVKKYTGKELFDEDDYGVAICPKKFYPGSYDYDDIDNLEFYDDDIVGRTFSITYDINDVDENGNIYVSSQKTKEFKIVGLYDVSPIYGDYNVCYIGGNEFEEIGRGMYDAERRNVIASIRVVVDSVENNKYVNDELSKIGLSGETVLVYDYAGVSNAKMITIFIVAVLTVFIIFISELYCKKNLVKNVKNIKLLYSLGFSKNDISKIHLLTLLLISAISFILALLVFIVVVSFNRYTPIDLSTIGIPSIVIIIIIMLVIPLLLLKLSIKRLLSNNQKLLVGDSE